MKVNTVVKVLFDAILIYLSWIITFHYHFDSQDYSQFYNIINRLGLLSIFTTILLNLIYHNYKRNWKYFGYLDFIDFYKAQIYSIIIIIIFSHYFFPQINIGRFDFIVYFIISTQVQLLPRGFSRLRNVNKIVFPKTTVRTVIFGLSEDTEKFIRDTITDKRFQFNILRIYDLSGKLSGQRIHRIPIYPSYKYFENVLVKEKVELILLDSSMNSSETKEIKNMGNSAEIEVLWLNEIRKMLLEDKPTIDLTKYHTYSYDILKKINYNLPVRIFDIVFSVLLIILLSPVFLLISFLIIRDSGRPVFFIHDRYGKDLQVFKMFKFRTMINNAQEYQKKTLVPKSTKEPIIKFNYEGYTTSVGEFLRKTSLDELAQLFNVVLGDMSLVGPRPMVPMEVDLYDSDQLKNLKIRFSVKPGITGLAQINGRSDISFQDLVDWDIKFVKERNIIIYFIILLRTVPYIFTKKSSY